ncbi:conserved hypothetical protein; putative membrane protein [Bradyrhizobium sp. ORS 285]|nr:conserved membrane hypothetical protein [Bradyrhizobium sp. ORS 285]SMX59517.1 conserved hypothetical protein; putative membrane protein [Bradyrhizobium sp. ORS 285]
MIMDTDQLIRSLAADNAQRVLPVGIIMALALMAATPVSTAMLLIGLGIRPDIWLAVRNPFFDLKFVVTTALAIPALIISVHLSRPEASLHGWGWLLIAPIVVLIGGMTAEMMLPQRAPMMARLVGHNSMLCVSAIPVLSLPILGAALFGLRHGAPSRPAVAGGIAGLVSAGIAATLYAAHCTDDSPLFVATWYTIAAVVVAGLGALIGRRVLRY